MKRIIQTVSVFAILLWFVSCQSSPASIELFNGKDLNGWLGYTDPEGNADNADVFKVKDGCIWISGIPFGYLRTEKVYEDYILHVEWRWDGPATNSGLFQRLALPDKTFPNAIEVQLCVGKAGDFVLLGGAKINETKETGPFPVVQMKNPSNEKPVGEWNTADITCKGDTIEVIINGLLQNKATGAPTSGYIALQSEGGPIMFRNIKLTPLK